jgi:hypothetical protein
VKWLLLKKWVGPALGVAVIVILSGLWFHGYSTGKSSERQVQELRTAEILLRAAQEAERIREHDLKLVMEARDRETRIIERIRTVDIHVLTPECVDLGDEWLHEYNDVIEAANTRKSVD